MEGWISLHRKLTEWEWYTDANAMRLFVHCLIKANHKDKKWKGICIKRGQFLTSRDKLSQELNLSVMQIRTALNKLKSTSDITIKTSTKNTVITVTNYDLYQDSNQQPNLKITSKQPANNQQITTTNNVNNVNNVNNEIKIPEWIDEDVWLEYLQTRKKLKCVNSPKALNTIINKLVKYETEKKGDGNLALELANSNAWKNPYKPKPDKEEIEQPRERKSAFADW